MTEAFDLDRLGGYAALDRLLLEILAAGEDALRLYQGGAAQRVVKKNDRSPVTEADRAVEARLRAYLERAHPALGFLGEESGSDGQSAAMRALVDPIDGTRAFCRGLPTWSILLSVLDEAGPALGVAYFPAGGDLLVGLRGGGARLNGRPLRCSAVASPEEATISHGALSQFTDEGLGDVLIALGEGTYTQRGFADFDGYRQLLLGKVDAMIDPGVKAWDVGPASVMVPEAGGRWSSFTGEADLFAGRYVATNGLIHEPLLDLIARAGGAEQGA